MGGLGLGNHSGGVLVHGSAALLLARFRSLLQESCQEIEQITGDGDGDGCDGEIDSDPIARVRNYPSGPFFRSLLPRHESKFLQEIGPINEAGSEVGGGRDQAGANCQRNGQRFRSQFPAEQQDDQRDGCGAGPEPTVPEEGFFVVPEVDGVIGIHPAEDGCSNGSDGTEPEHGGNHLVAISAGYPIPLAQCATEQEGDGEMENHEVELPGILDDLIERGVWIDQGSFDFFCVACFGDARGSWPVVAIIRMNGECGESEDGRSDDHEAKKFGAREERAEDQVHQRARSWAVVGRTPFSVGPLGKTPNFMSGEVWIWRSCSPFPIVYGKAVGFPRPLGNPTRSWRELRRLRHLSDASLAGARAMAEVF